MKKILLVLLMLIVLLIAFLLVNTFRFQSKQLSNVSKFDMQVSDKVVQNLSKAIQIPTISYHDSSRMDTSVFKQFQSFLENTYPLTHQQLQKKVLANYTLLYQWKGANATKKPILMMAHQDVVAIEQIDEWKYPPFSGQIAEERIWGRGALDNKASLIGILESTEQLLKEGFQPKQDIYFAFSHDEEVNGSGAMAIVKYLKESGVQLDCVLDEGLLVAEGMMPGLEKPVALVGISEKGYVTIVLTARGDGGHSSMPGKKTAIGQLSKALVAMEENPLPQRYNGPIKSLFNYVGPEMPFFQKLAFANTWLLKPVLLRELAKVKTTNALSRTTTAPTILKAGVQENVLAKEAAATINFRIYPGETPATVLAHTKSVVQAFDVEAKIEGHTASPAPIADTATVAFRTIHRTIREVFPESVVAPSLVLATTDSRFYVEVADNVYRFFPLKLNSEEIGTVHSNNEHIRVDNLKECVRFYYRLMKNFN